MRHLIAAAIFLLPLLTPANSYGEPNQQQLIGAPMLFIDIIQKANHSAESLGDLMINSVLDNDPAFNYSDISKSPAIYIGRARGFSCKILEATKTANYTMLIAVTAGDPGDVWIIKSVVPKSRNVDLGLADVIGIITGVSTYTMRNGRSITAPSLLAMQPLAYGEFAKIARGIEGKQRRGR